MEFPKLYCNALILQEACTLEFDTSAVRIAESGTFSFESVVSVHLGYKDDCEEVFAGEVTDFETRYNEYGNERFLVICSSFLHRLKNSYKPASFESKRLSDILKGMFEPPGSDDFKIRGKALSVTHCL